MQTNCPNCGAPIKHYYNHNCEYCGTFLNNTSEKIKHFKNCDLRNIKVSLDISPQSLDVIITIKAFTAPKISYLEEWANNLMIVSSDDIGKVVEYRIAIPLFDFRNYTYNELVHKVLNSLPKPFMEYADEIMCQLIELVKHTIISTRWLK